jgi:hypothetical protein
MDAILLQSDYRCFGHSCDNLHGGNTRNTNIFIMCRDHSPVKIHTVFCLNFLLRKWQNGDEYKILEANNGRQQYGSVV